MRSYCTDAFNVHDPPEKNLEKLRAREYTVPLERPTGLAHPAAPAATTHAEVKRIAAEISAAIPLRPYRPTRTRDALDVPRSRTPDPTHSPQQHSLSSTGSNDELPTLKHIGEHAQARRLEVEPAVCRPGQPCGLELRDWDLDELIRRRRTAEGFEYLVRWKDSRLKLRHVRQRADGSKFVECSGRVWEVVAAVEVVQTGDQGEWQLEVMWQDSWNSGADLQDARDLVDAFNATLPAEPEWIGNTAVDAGARPAQLDNIFRPTAGFDYSLAIRAELADKTTKPIREMLDADSVRPVMFTDTFVQSNGTANITRASKANAMLAHDSGYEQPVPCEPCERGVGPFPECVARHSGVEVCTNCQFNEKGPPCNFHSKHPRYREYVREHAIATALQRGGPSAPSTPPPPASPATSSPDPVARSSVQPFSPASSGTEPTSPMDGFSSPAGCQHSEPPSSRLSFTTAQEGRARGAELPCNRAGTHRRHHSDAGEEASASDGGCPSTDLEAAEQAEDSLILDAFTSNDTCQSRPQQATAASTSHARRKRRHSSIPSSDRSSLPDTDHEPDADSGNDSHARPAKATKRDPHAHCLGGMSHCIAYTQLPAVPYGIASSSTAHGVVYSDHHFIAGSATPAQIRFVLSRLYCDWADHFNEHWQAFRSSRVDRGLDVEMTREQHVRDVLWRD